MPPTRPEDSQYVMMYPAEWSGWARRVAAISLIIATIYAATLLGPVLQSTVLALIIALILFYPIRALARRTPLSYGLSVALVFVLYLFVATFLIVNLVLPVTAFIGNLLTDAQDQFTEFLQELRNYQPADGIINEPVTGMQVDLNFVLEPLSQLARGENLQQLTGVVPNVLGAVTNTAGQVTNIVTGLFLSHFLAFLFLLEVPNGYRWFVETIPLDHRREYALLLDRAAMVWNNFFRGQLIVGSIIGSLTWLQLSIMGIPAAIVIAVFTGFISLIPILGGFVALIPIGLVPLLQGSRVLELDPLPLALLVVAINIAMQQVIWNVVAPKITGDAVALPMPVIILGLFVGTAIGGVLGAFLAAPVMGILRVLLTYVVKKIRGGDPFPGETDPTRPSDELFASPPLPGHHQDEQEEGGTPVQV